jgi:hypothetical protein
MWQFTRGYQTRHLDLDLTRYGRNFLEQWRVSKRGALVQEARWPGPAEVGSKVGVFLKGGKVEVKEGENWELQQ